MSATETLDLRPSAPAAVQALDATVDFRPLDEGELDSVNGGIIPVLIGIGLFAGGMTIGAIMANYKYTGNFWGDI